ncbi:type II toxin-antitoxin system HipA family toxin [Chrysiogenes arsenatis]|uniref:type II toxin-antitoxin system HipA family toxin n=1 Tax=Chrysiogenes arsenatis TaxID=309797 RepID=UPI0003F4B15C|nr:type II toxin-antitoxin system HipA family toxin [Chrysiogenes arsenatis]
MAQIDVSVFGQKAGKLFFEAEHHRYGFNYTAFAAPISLIMPCRNATYLWKQHLHPIFDMNMPEGYIFELFKNFLAKEYGYVDDFLIFSRLCPNIQSHLTYQSWCEVKRFPTFHLDDVLQNDTPDTFQYIVAQFLEKNAISGVQPKSLALLTNKESLSSREYIIKTWGDEYPQLALNEFFCLQAVAKAGIPVPTVQLSANNRFLVLERFNYDKDTGVYYGFEEIATLLGKNKEEKYSGSYEQIAKVVKTLTSDSLHELQHLYALIVMNFLLKNGDGHLKNFGILYNEDRSRTWLAPAYDVVNTTLYFPRDRPALSLFGKKIWFGRKKLEKFGVQHCSLSSKQAEDIFDQCANAVAETLRDVAAYMRQDDRCAVLGKQLTESWSQSLRAMKEG